MLESIKQLLGHKLIALDGEIGHVEDFYFDDQNWAVRYVIADTGSWLPGRKVLISPHAFVGAHKPGILPPLNLTRKQIEDSPPIETHKPVSRQYEEDYYRYFGWPYYWQGGGLWGMSGFPILERSPEPLPSEFAAANVPKPNAGDTHLRSAIAVNGYHFRVNGEIIGHVCDFMMDDQSWALSQLVVKVGHRLTGNEVQVPTDKVFQISYSESTVNAMQGTKIIKECPTQHMAPETAVH